MSLSSEHIEFCSEAKAYELRFRCQDCAHMRLVDESCIFGYPNEALRDPDSLVRTAPGKWIFCKYFELV